jgi:hypothetical protein
MMLLGTNYEIIHFDFFSRLLLSVKVGSDTIGSANQMSAQKVEVQENFPRGLCAVLEIIMHCLLHQPRVFHFQSFDGLEN